MGEACSFDLAWIGRCKMPADQLSDRGMCIKHESLKCCSCGKPAVRNCDHTGGLVCGCDLCAGCEHSPPPSPDSPSFMGMNGSHRPREQARAEWERYHKQCDRHFAELRLKALEQQLADERAKLAAMEATP